METEGHPGLEDLLVRMDHEKAWEYEQKAKQILSQLKIRNFDQQVKYLSGGQLKRVALANALITEPDLLILDEPTTYLDICHQLEVLELIEKLNQDEKLTVVMVLHDINQAIRYSQDILVLEDGIIKYHGNPVEIMTHETIGEIFKVDADIEIRQGRPSVIVNGLL